MALALTPVTIDQVAASSGVATSTHSFSPASGAMVAVAVTWLPFSNSAMTITCADSHGNSYTAGPHASDTGPVSTSAVFTFTYSSAPGSTTLTVTSTDTASASVQIAPVVITGQAASQSGAATLSTNGSSTAINGSITPTIFGSFVIGAVGMGSTTAIAAAAGCTSLGTWNDGNSGDTAGAFQTAGITLAPTVGTTVGFTCASSHLFCIAALEILPAVTQPWPLQAVQGTTNSTSPLALTLPLSTSAGSTLIVCSNGNASTNNPSVTGVTLGGSAGNFAQVITAGVVSSDFQTVSIWADPNCASGQTAVSVAFSFSGTLGALTATVLEVPGLLTTAPNSDKTVSTVQNTNTTSWSSGATATTSQAAEFAAAVVGSYLSTGVGAINGPAAPWANLPQKNSPGASIGQLVGFQPLTTTQTVTYSGTTANSNQYTAVVATFKAAAAGTSAASRISSQAVKRAAYY